MCEVASVTIKNAFSSNLDFSSGFAIVQNLALLPKISRFYESRTLWARNILTQDFCNLSESIWIIIDSSSKGVPNKGRWQLEVEAKVKGYEENWKMCVFPDCDSNPPTWRGETCLPKRASFPGLLKTKINPTGLGLEISPSKSFDISGFFINMFLGPFWLFGNEWIVVEMFSGFNHMQMRQVFAVA